MTELKDRNWGITYVGLLAAALLSIGYIYRAVNMVEFKWSMILAGAAGLIYAITAKLSSTDRFRTIGKPLSGFLAMISGITLVAAAALFAVSSFEVLTGIFSSGGELLPLLRSLVVTAVGLAGFLLGTYLTVTGTSLMLWDRLDSKVSVGPQRSDIMFAAILAGITAFSIFGTAFLSDIPFDEWIGTAQTVLISSDPLSSTITGLMMIASYISVSKLWSALPIREAVPASGLDTYDRLSTVDTVLKWLLVPAMGIAVALTDFMDLQQISFLENLAQPLVRQLLLYTVITSLAVVLGIKLLQLVTGDRSRIWALVPYLLFGVAAWMIAPQLTFITDSIITVIPKSFSSAAESFVSGIDERNVVLILMTAASGLSFALKSFMGMLRGFGIVPRGLEGTTMAATGVFMTSIGLHIFSTQPSATMLFTGVALSLVIWEIGKRSVVLGMEVGRKGSSLQAEVVQVLTKVLVALIAVVIARTLLVFVQQMEFVTPDGPRAVMVFMLAAAGVTLIAFSLREYT